MYREIFLIRVSKYATIFGLYFITFSHMKKSLYSVALIGAIALTSLVSAREMENKMPERIGSGMMIGTGMFGTGKYGTGMKNYGQEVKKFVQQRNQVRKDMKEGNRIGSGVTQTGNTITAEQLACVRTALAKREAAILTANNSLFAATNSGLTVRTAALYKAWMLTGSIERKIAIKSAWDTARVSMKSAQETDKKARDIAWKTFKTEVQACKVPEAMMEGEGETR